MEQTSLKEMRAELNANQCAYIEHHLHYRYIQPELDHPFDESKLTPEELVGAKDRVKRLNAMMVNWSIGSMAWYSQEIAVMAQTKEEDPVDDR
jgi:hypothetical protein